jgi:hypothetical protein
MRQMNRKKIHIFLLALLGPTCSFGRLGGGDPDPELMVLLSPSSVYSAVLWPCLAVAFVLLAALHRADWREQGGASAHRPLSVGCDAILSVVSAVALFGAYPHVYRNFLGMYLEMGLLEDGRFPRLLLPPILAMGKPVAGIALLAVWFVVHPGSIRFLARRVGKPDMHEPPVWPLALSFVGFSVWLFVALMRPLTMLID